jgi:hypothetical protein
MSPYKNPGPDVPETIYYLTPPCGGFPLAAIRERFTVTKDGRWADTRACSTCGFLHIYTPPKPAIILCVLHGAPEPTP